MNSKPNWCGPEYSENAQGLVLERKSDMAARGLGSPDIADALALTFSVPVFSRNSLLAAAIIWFRPPTIHSVLRLCVAKPIRSRRGSTTRLVGKTIDYSVATRIAANERSHCRSRLHCNQS